MGSKVELVLRDSSADETGVVYLRVDGQEILLRGIDNVRVHGVPTAWGAGSKDLLQGSLPAAGPVEGSRLTVLWTSF